MKADGHFARDVAKYLGVSRATLLSVPGRRSRVAPRRGQATPLHPRRGYRPTCAPPAGVSTDLRTPGGGIDRPAHPRRGYDKPRHRPGGIETTCTTSRFDSFHWCPHVSG